MITHSNRRRLHCPGCRHRVSIPTRTPVGSRARCGACGGLFRVPGGPADVARDAGGSDAVRSTIIGVTGRNEETLEEGEEPPIRRSGPLHVDLQVLLAEVRRRARSV